MSEPVVTCGNCRHEFAASALFCPHCGRAKVRAEDDDALLGKVLGDRFLVQERIGQGTSGRIYRAEHVTLRRKVAIKVLHHELSRDDLAIERFRREATMVGEVDNEHIVEIHDFGKTPDGRLYLAMELLEGETLDVILAREGQLPIDRVVDITIQVAESLVEAHAVGYIHRDLRPRNLLLSNRRGKPNFVKLFDFGLAKLVEHEGQAAQTSLGMTFGDPRYMSPEAARGDAIDRRADIYQLGCIAYEMLTGAPPFVGGRVFDVLSRHVSEAPVPVAKKRADCPRWLEVAVMRMLAKQPDERFATMTRVCEALRQGEQTGVVMEEITARHAETIPPPSVSRVMEKLGQLTKTAMGPHGGAPTADEVAQAAGVTRTGAAPAPAVAEPAEDLAKTVTRGPRGTPKVGVPVIDSSGAAAIEAVVASQSSAVLQAPTASPSGPVSAAGKAAVWSRPESQGTASSTGKLPAQRNKRDSAGISQVWYQDGEQMDGGDALDEPAAERLARARRLMPSSDSMSVYAHPQRPIGKIVAIGAGVVVVVIVLLVVLIGGGSGNSDDRASASAARGAIDAAPRAPVVVVDAGAAPAVAVDAGAKPAVAIDAGAAPAVAVDAGAVAPPAVDAGVKKDTTPIKKDTTPIKKDTHTTPPDHVDTPPDNTTPTGIPDDESKAKAEFFAKTGDGQLKSGDAQAAAGNFKKALELDPGNVSAMMGLGEVALGQGLYQPAIGYLKKASKRAGKSSQVWTLLGEAYLDSGNNKQAAAAYQKALQIDPDNAAARDGYNEASNRIPPPTDEP